RLPLRECLHLLRAGELVAVEEQDLDVGDAPGELLDVREPAARLDERRGPEPERDIHRARRPPWLSHRGLSPRCPRGGEASRARWQAKAPFPRGENAEALG